jgi:hypothetical protein
MASKADQMTEKMAQSSRTGEFTSGMVAPRKGERFRCTNCGMEIEVTKDCACKGDACAHFDCCGLEMAKV